MRHLYLLIFSLCLYISASGTELIIKPDYENINKLTHDNTSVFYYPVLFKRYIDNDTSLGQEDYKMLYYGYFFQPGYLMTGQNSTYNDSIRMLLNKEQPSKSDWKKAIRYIYSYFDSFPFDLEKLNILFIAYHNINDEYYAMKYRKKLEMLIKTILITGDGKTSKTGYHILKLDDEYALLSVLGYEFNGHQTYKDTEDTDFLQISKNPDGIEGMYFDVKQIKASRK